MPLACRQVSREGEEVATAHGPVFTFCYDLPAVVRFCRSCAVSVVMQRRTTIEWVTSPDAAIQAIYRVFFWKGAPGTAEIRSAPVEAIERETDDLQLHFLRTWLEKLTAERMGPVLAANYLENLERIRDGAREALQQLFRDANNINAEVARELGTGITRLASIKLASTVGLAGVGAAGTLVLVGGQALLATGVSLGYSVGCTLVKHWQTQGLARAVAVDLGTAALNEASNYAAATGAANTLAAHAKSEHVLRSVQGMVRQASARVGARGLSYRQVQRAGERLAHARALEGRAAQGLAQSGRLLGVANGLRVAVPVVFCAAEVWGAIEEFREDVGAR